MTSNALSARPTPLKPPKVCTAAPLPPQVPEPWPPNELYATVIIHHYPSPGPPIIKRHTGLLEVNVPHERYQRIWDPGPNITQVNIIYNPATDRWRIEVTADWLSNWIGQLSIQDLRLVHADAFDTGHLTQYDAAHNSYFYCRITL